MTLRNLSLIALSVASLGGCAVLQRGPVGNVDVARPTVSVDLQRYSGRWYEIGRYENGFERGCEGVTAEYTRLSNGEIGVRNTCREGAPNGPERVSEGRARIVEGSDGARLKVSFFGPFYLGDYWILARSPDYAWSIVGEPSGRYLWLLSRTPDPDAETRARIYARAGELGYDLSLVRPTRH